MHNENQLTIPGVINDVRRACEFVVQEARKAGLDDQSVYHCELAVDEVCTNVVEHGFRGDGANREINIRCNYDDERFSVTVMDDSKAFDPLSIADPDPKANLEDRKSGGWGIYFVKKLMDEVRYQHEGQQNQLVMVKRLRNESAFAERGRPVSPNGVSMAELNDGTWLVSFWGRLDSDFSTHSARTLLELVQVPCRYLVVDMSGVVFISSNGIKSLMTAYKQLLARGGNMVFASLSPRVNEAFEMIGLHTVISIYPSVAQAVASVKLPR
jgi:anti-anti-sigma factor